MAPLPLLGSLAKDGLRSFLRPKPIQLAAARGARGMVGRAGDRQPQLLTSYLAAASRRRERPNRIMSLAGGVSSQPLAAAALRGIVALVESQPQFKLYKVVCNSALSPPVPFQKF